MYLLTISVQLVTGIQNNLKPNDFVIDHKIKNIDASIHDVTSKRMGRPKKSGFKGTPTKKKPL